MQDHGVLPAEGGLFKSERTADSSRKVKGRVGWHRRQGTAHKSTGPQVDGLDRSNQEMAMAGGGEEKSGEWKEIPFSWVVRGRQERHLINQQVSFIRATGCWGTPVLLQVSEKVYAWAAAAVFPPPTLVSHMHKTSKGVCLEYSHRSFGVNATVVL